MFIANVSQHSINTLNITLCLKIISNNNFSEEIYITSPLKENQFKPGDVIGFEEIKNGKPNVFFDIDYDKHKNLITPEKIRESKISLNLFKNKNLAKFIIENHLDSGHKDTALLNLLHKQIQSRNPIPHSTFKEIVDNYQICYSESGYDKPGDWSIATISIYTNNKITFQFHSDKIRSSSFGDVFGYKDEYLSMLFPNYNFSLASGKDDADCLFKSQIIEQLKSEIGEIKLDEIKKLCNNLTENIKNMALLVYDKNKHLSYIEKLYQKLKAELYLKLN